jgi:hypothetical protein
MEAGWVLRLAWMWWKKHLCYSQESNPGCPDFNLVIMLNFINIVLRTEDPLDIFNRLTSNIYEFVLLFIVFKMLDCSLQYRVQNEILKCVAGFNIP